MKLITDGKSNVWFKIRFGNVDLKFEFKAEIQMKGEEDKSPKKYNSIKLNIN